MTRPITVRQHATGEIEITDAPEVAEFSRWFLLEASSPYLHFDGTDITINASNGVFVYQVQPSESSDIVEAKRIHYPINLAARRASEGRCMRCGGFPKICGHGLSFKERIKSVGVQTLWAASSH